MRIGELKPKSKKELEGLLKDDREKIRKLRFDLAAGKVKNVREIRRLKKEVSQILTIINNELKQKNNQANKTKKEAENKTSSEKK